MNTMIKIKEIWLCNSPFLLQCVRFLITKYSYILFRFSLSALITLLVITDFAFLVRLFLFYWYNATYPYKIIAKSLKICPFKLFLQISYQSFKTSFYWFRFDVFYSSLYCKYVLYIFLNIYQSPNAEPRGLYFPTAHLPVLRPIFQSVFRSY